MSRLGTSALFKNDLLRQERHNELMKPGRMTIPKGLGGLFGIG
jgi:hypothetical protein